MCIGAIFFERNMLMFTYILFFVFSKHVHVILTVLSFSVVCVCVCVRYVILGLVIFVSLVNICLCQV